MDRYSDSLYYLGLLLYFIDAGQLGYAILAFSACIASFEISYVRARSEGLNASCFVGFWERGERTVILLLGVLFHNPQLTVLILGILPHGTVLRRLLHSRAKLLRPEGSPLMPDASKNRLSPTYLLTAGLLILALILIRPL